jgi:hypothetical protein
MTDTSPLSPDLPELRLICQLAGIRPDRFAKALNDPQGKHCSVEELVRYLDAAERVLGLVRRIYSTLDPEIQRVLTEKQRA